MSSRPAETTNGTTRLPVRSTSRPKIAGERLPAMPNPLLITPPAVPRVVGRGSIGVDHSTGLVSSRKKKASTRHAVTTTMSLTNRVGSTNTNDMSRPPHGTGGRASASWWSESSAGAGVLVYDSIAERVRAHRARRGTAVAGPDRVGDGRELDLDRTHPRAARRAPRTRRSAGPDDPVAARATATVLAGPRSGTTPEPGARTVRAPADSRSGFQPPGMRDGCRP